MGELVSLNKWKLQKQIEQINLSKEKLDNLMEFLCLEREFIMFDASGKPVLLKCEGVKENVTR